MAEGKKQMRTFCVGLGYTRIFRAFAALGFSVFAFLLFLAFFADGGVAPSLAICGGPPSVVASHEESDDGE